MKKYIKLCQAFNKVMLFISVLFIVAATILCFLQVVMRNTISYSFTWAEETTRYLVIFSVYFASGHIFYINANPTVELIDFFIPKKIKLYMNYLFYVLIGVFLALMTYYAYYLIGRNMQVWCASIHIPWAVPFLAVLIGTLNMLLQIPAKFYANHQNILGLSRLESGAEQSAEND